MGPLLAIWMGVASAFPLPQEVPDPRWRGGWITDDADILSPEAERRIDGHGDALARSTGVELVLVTVLDVSDTPSSLLADLFARWELGRHRGQGAMLGLWVADRSEWVWRMRPDSLPLIEPPVSFDAPGLEGWYTRASRRLAVQPAPTGQPEGVGGPPARKSLHPWSSIIGLVCLVMLVLMGGGGRRD